MLKTSVIDARKNIRREQTSSVSSSRRQRIKIKLLTKKLRFSCVRSCRDQHRRLFKFVSSTNDNHKREKKKKNVSSWSEIISIDLQSTRFRCVRVGSFRLWHADLAFSFYQYLRDEFVTRDGCRKTRFVDQDFFLRFLFPLLFSLYNWRKNKRRA